jgi:SAM-dependent methyltransferase
MSDTGDPRLRPWLSIPAEDYEGHMASENVQQLQYLSRVFKELLAEFQPESVAVLGVGAGNGLEHIDRRRVKRVVGIDVNPSYLDLARARHGSRIPNLELLCADVAACELNPESIDFVYAALIFEYVEPAPVVARIAAWLRPGGNAAALSQLPSESHETVSDTQYVRLKALEPHIRLVEPAALSSLFANAGLSEVRSRFETIAGDKGFFLGIYRR